MDFYHIVQSQCTENRALFLVPVCNDMFSVQPRNRNRKADSEIVRNRKVQALHGGVVPVEKTRSSM